MRDGDITVFVMWKRLESRVTVSEDITELFIFSYLTTSWKMLWYDLFESTRVLFYLNLTIDEKKKESDIAGSVYFQKIFCVWILLFNWRVCFTMRRSYIRQWEESDCLKDFKWTLICRKRIGEIRDVG